MDQIKTCSSYRQDKVHEMPGVREVELSEESAYERMITGLSQKI